MRYLLTLALCLAAGLALAGEFTVTGGFRVSAGDPPKKAAPKDYTPELPEGAKPYKRARFTQSIAVRGNSDVIEAVPIKLLERKWHVSGGMEGVHPMLWRSEKFKYVPPAPVRAGIANVFVKTDGGGQFNRGIVRSYPDGTRFDDVLYSTETGKVFEHRVRQKKNGAWESDVVYKDESARPKGYAGLKMTACAECHSEAGTGKYGVGLVPGGDTVLSDPLPWSVRRGVDPEEKLSDDPPRSGVPHLTFSTYQANGEVMWRRKTAEEMKPNQFPPVSHPPGKDNSGRRFTAEQTGADKNPDKPPASPFCACIDKYGKCYCDPQCECAERKAAPKPPPQAIPFAQPRYYVPQGKQNCPT